MKEFIGNNITLISMIAAFCTTSSFVPQAIQVIKTKDTSSISLLMYSMFVFGILLWFIYGVFIGEVAIYMSNGITFCLASIVLGYKIKYK